MIDSFQSGVAAFKQGQFHIAVKCLEDFCRTHPDPLAPKFLQAQMYLVKGYAEIGQHLQAIALCNQLIRSDHTRVQIWARKIRPHLTPSLSLNQPVGQSTKTISGQTAKDTDLDEVRQRVDCRLHHHSSGNQVNHLPDKKTRIFRPKSDTYFTHHFETFLSIRLKTLEAHRKLITRLYFTISIPIALVVVAAFISMNLAKIVAVIGLGIWSAVILEHYRPYRKSYKQEIIVSILEFIDSDTGLNHAGNFQYSQHPPKTSNTYHVFCKSQLFRLTPSLFSEEDCITGKWGKTELYFSEIRATWKDKTKKKSFFLPIFDGLIFQATFNKSFHGHTVIVPDFAEKTFGSFGLMLQSLYKNHGKELIKLEDPEFERLFAVYGDDQVEARYILSPSLMQRLINLKKKMNRELRIAFIDNHIVITIPFRKDLFEPRVFRSLLNPKPALQYFHVMQDMLSIVDELNLNRRIWKS